MRNIIYFSILISTLMSCRTLSPSVMFETDKNFEYDQLNNIPKSIVISPFDQLNIIMTTNAGHILLEQHIGTSQNMNFSNNNQRNTVSYMVDQDSLVKIPTLGRIKLGGLSIAEAEELLEQLFSENYQSPFVRITITNRKVILFLEESTQGHIVNLPEENMTLIEAIAKTGGLSNNSKSYQIKLIRNLNNNTKVYKYNFRNIENFKAADMSLEANDIIYIESKPRYVSKVLAELQPYLVLMSSLILVYGIILTN